eukprot:CFRG6951T1
MFPLRRTHGWVILVSAVARAHTNRIGTQRDHNDLDARWDAESTNGKRHKKRTDSNMYAEHGQPKKAVESGTLFDEARQAVRRGEHQDVINFMKKNIRGILRAGVDANGPRFTNTQIGTQMSSLLTNASEGATGREHECEPNLLSTSERSSIDSHAHPSMDSKESRIMYDALTNLLVAITSQGRLAFEERVGLAKTALSYSYSYGFNPRTSHYNHCFHFCTKSSNYEFETVWGWYKEMKLHPNNSRPNPSTISLMQTLCAKNLKREEAWECFREMHARNLKPEIRSLTTLMNLFAQVGDEGKVTQIYKCLEVQPEFTLDIYVYNALFRLYAVTNNQAGIDALLASLDAHGILPDTATMAILVGWKIQDSKNFESCFGLIEDFMTMDIKPNVIVFNTMLTALTQRNDMARATQVLERMQSMNIIPDSYSYNALLKTTAHSGQTAKAWRMLEMMKAEHVDPDVVTYVHITNSYGCLITDMDVQRILREMRDNGGVHMNMTTMFHFMNNLGPSAALAVLRCLLRDPLDLHLKSRVKTKHFGLVLLLGLDIPRPSANNANVRLTDTTLLTNVLLEMELHQINVTEDFWMDVLKFIAVRGRKDDVTRLIRLLSESSRPNFAQNRVKSFNEIIALSSSVENGEAVFDGMETVRGVKPDRTTYEAMKYLCVLHEKFDVAEKYDFFLKKKDENDPYYSMRGSIVKDNN